MSYLFGADWEKSIHFHRAMERLLDPDTHALISEHVLTPEAGSDLSCLVVGAGGGSTARWLADRVWPNGTVLATDIDIQFLSRSQPTNMIVLRHDLERDEPIESEFDFVHVRLVLNNLKNGESCFRQLASRLRPRGVIIVQDYDFYTRVTYPYSPAVEVFNLAQIEYLKEHGGDPMFGRRLLSLSDAIQLRVVHFGARIYAYRGASEDVAGRKLSFERRRQDLREKGVLSEPELSEIQRLLDDPNFTWTSPALFTLVGRR